MNPLRRFLLLGAKCSLTLLVFSACSETYLSRAELLDPQTCQSCHPQHYEAWSGSMHAYAAEDPVFLAMNARGQRETNGALGTFCVNCHAPMAVREGLTADGLNLDTVPSHLKGVTCFFCHTAEAVTGTHNAPITLAEEPILGGAIADPIENPAHASRYSALHDRRQGESAALCGSCHDIVTPAGVHLERTFAEWQSSLFAKEPGQQTCGRCHMPSQSGVAADFPGVPVRTIHDHAMPGVDLALTEFPGVESQRVLVDKALATTLLAELCVRSVAGQVEVRVTLENIAAGHAVPSGAAQDRRLWLELVAYREDQVIFSTGVVADDVAVRDSMDPNLWLFGDQLFDATGKNVHMFWEATRYESQLLPAPTTVDPTDPNFIETHVSRGFMLPSLPDRVHMRMRIRAMDRDVLVPLVESGDLATEILDRVPTLDLAATVLEWQKDRDPACIPEL